MYAINSIPDDVSTLLVLVLLLFLSWLLLLALFAGLEEGRNLAVVQDGNDSRMMRLGNYKNLPVVQKLQKTRWGKNSSTFVQQACEPENVYVFRWKRIKIFSASEIIFSSNTGAIHNVLLPWNGCLFSVFLDEIDRPMVCWGALWPLGLPLGLASVSIYIYIHIHSLAIQYNATIFNIRVN